MVDNSGITSCTIISCIGPEIFLHILTKFCLMKVRGSGNYDTRCIMPGSHGYCLGSTVYVRLSVNGHNLLWECADVHPRAVLHLDQADAHQSMIIKSQVLVVDRSQYLTMEPLPLVSSIAETSTLEACMQCGSFTFANFAPICHAEDIMTHHVWTLQSSACYSQLQSISECRVNTTIAYAYAVHCHH